MRSHSINHVFLTFGATLLLACSSDLPSESPSIILISVDTLRSDHLPVYGYHQIETPAIDRFRKDGVLFHRAFTVSPLTLPAHSSLLTGLLPTRHRVRDNVGYRFEATSVASLGGVLGAVGYATGGFVSSFVLRTAAGLGATFDHYDDRFEAVENRTMAEIQRPGSETTNAALTWIDQQNGPFFAFIHLFEPHAPYAPSAEIAARWGDTYDGEIVETDGILGEFLDGLRDRSLYDPSLVILVADHGEGLGEHGEREHGILLYRQTVQIPLVIKFPDNRDRGGSVDTPVQIVDVAPTILSIAGVRSEEPMDGISLSDLEPAGRPLYIETLYPRLHFGWAELRGLVDGQYHYVSEPNPELFDYVGDPAEEHNLLLANRPVATHLRTTLDSFSTVDNGPKVAVSEEAQAKLAALGYLTGFATTENLTQDPREHVGSIKAIDDALKLGRAGDHEGAVAILSQLVDRYPSMLDARYQLASALRTLGRADEALEQHRLALEQAPVPIPGVIIEIARILLDQGETDEARAHAELSSEVLPVESAHVLARIALVIGDLDEALRQGRRAVEAESVPRPDQLLFLAQIHNTRQEYQQALNTLASLRSRLQGRGEGTIPWLSYERGEALARLGTNSEAVVAFEQEISDYPANVRAYEKLAFVLAAERRFDEIDPLLDRMAMASKTPAGYSFVAQTADRLGDTQGAQEWRRRAERLPEE